jgi:hypothetical protein
MVLNSSNCRATFSTYVCKFVMHPFYMGVIIIHPCINNESSAQCDKTRTPCRLSS